MTFWKRGSKLEPVVDIIFNGKDSNVEDWFHWDRIIQIIRGPNIKKKTNYNFWGFKSEPRLTRDFYVSLSHGGCANDHAMICVSEK